MRRALLIRAQPIALSFLLHAVFLVLPASILLRGNPPLPSPARRAFAALETIQVVEVPAAGGATAPTKELETAPAEAVAVGPHKVAVVAPEKFSAAPPDKAAVIPSARRPQEEQPAPAQPTVETPVSLPVASALLTTNNPSARETVTPFSTAGPLPSKGSSRQVNEPAKPTVATDPTSPERTPVPAPPKTTAAHSSSLPTQASPAAAPSKQPTRTPARAIRRTQPPYPDAARRRGQTGTVHLRLEISPEGAVRQVELAASSGFSLLDKAALAAARTWQFEPATENGRPVAEWRRVAVQFQLEETK